jgi:DegV family protein with EDD domain
VSKVALVTDSTTHLPAEIMRPYPIWEVPIMIIWGAESLRDGVDIQADEFYNRLRLSSKSPGTSQPSPQTFQEIFSQLLAEGYDILGVFISTKFSGTYASAKQAQALFPGKNIEIIDSLTGSMGAGWPVLSAARASQAGANLAECKALVEKALKHTGILLMVDDLQYLHRGGRIGGAQRFLGTALKLKPILEVVESGFIGLERVRTRQKAFGRLVELLEERIAGRSPVHLAALHASTIESAEQLLQAATARIHTIETMLADVSPGVGVHLGPGCAGYAFMAGID